MEAGGPARNNSNNRGRPRYRYSRICFTINNWTTLEYDNLISNSWKWMVVGKEVGDDGTPHLQGAAVLGKQMDLSSIKRLPGMSRAHIESMMGTPQQSLAYCSKQDPAAFTSGSMPEEGKRNDLLEAYDALTRGATMKQMVEDHGIVAMKYFSNLSKCRSVLAPPRVQPPKVIWIFGPTGVGKTRCCTDFALQYLGGNYWMSNGDLQWFDGYDGEPVCIIDDFRGKHCSFPFLLRLLDRYPFRVPIKGGFQQWSPDFIFITAPYSPDEVFRTRKEFQPEDVRQLERRITKVIHWKDDGVSQNSVMEAIKGLVLPESKTISLYSSPAFGEDISDVLPTGPAVIDLTGDDNSDLEDPDEELSDGIEDGDLDESENDEESLYTHLFGRKSLNELKRNK